MRFLLLLTVILIAGCRGEEKPLERVEVQRPLMGTLFRVIAYVENQEAGRKAINSALDEAEEFAGRATDYDPNSELNQLVKSPIGEPVKVSPHLYKVLDLGRQLARETEGVFDPTYGPLTHLWREMRRTGRVPGEDEIEEAKARCGIKHLKFDAEARTITVLKEGMQLDLGGIAKGYAADMIHDQLKKSGISRTLTAVAGDLRMGDAPPDKDGWTVGLRSFSLELTNTMTLKNCAVSTSGDLYQKVNAGEKTYSHIIDLQTGLGLTSRRAASVIAPEAKLTDPLATAACLMKDPKKLGENRPKISLRVLYDDQSSNPVFTGLFEESR